MRNGRLIVWGAALIALASGVVFGSSRAADAQEDPPEPPHCEAESGTEIIDIPQPPRPYSVYHANETVVRQECQPGDGYIWVNCHEEGGAFTADERGIVAVAKDSQEWWLEEIAIESSGDGGLGCTLAEHPPDELCGERTPAERQNTHGLIDDDCWGTYPSENYQMAWKDGGPFDFKNKMQGWLGSWMFNIGKGAILLVLWLIGWGFRFDVTEFTRAASHVAGSYQTNVIGPFKLEDFVWFVLIAWAGFAALRRKLGMAVGEIGVAIVLAGLSTVLFTHRADYMDSTADLMDETSARLLVAGQDERCLPAERVPPGTETKGRADCGPGEVLVRSDPARPAELEDEVRPLQRHVHETFVEQPWAYLNWGRMPTDECLEAQNEIASTGYQDDGWPERHMARAIHIVGEAVGGDRETGEPACNREADFVKDVTGKRMLGAFLNMVTSLVIAFLLGTMAITLVISKFTIAVLFAAIPFAAVAAVLPGAGRRLAWSWLGILVQVVVTVVGSSFMLVFVLIGENSVPQISEEFSLMERQGALLIVVVVAFAGIKRGQSAVQRAGEYVTDTLTRMTPAGAGWSAQARGLDLAGTARIAGRTAAVVGPAAGWGAFRGTAAVARTAGRPVRLGARTIAARRREARNDRRGRASFYQGNLSYRQAEDFTMGELTRSTESQAGMGPAPGGRAPRAPDRGEPIPSRLAGAVVLGKPDTGAPKTFMLYRGAPRDLDPSNRRELLRYAARAEDYSPVWDTAVGRFTHPIQARKERRHLQHHVEYQQWQTGRFIGAQIQAGVFDPKIDKLVDRFGNPWKQGTHY